MIVDEYKEKLKQELLKHKCWYDTFEERIRQLNSDGSRFRFWCPFGSKDLCEVCRKWMKVPPTAVYCPCYYLPRAEVIKRF